MKKLTFPIVLAALACAAPAAAQNVASPTAPRSASQSDLRHHIYVMEGALARAVDYGAKQLNRELVQVMPGIFMLEGEARARGVHLEGYGVFFDVRVPMMRQSMVWSLRMMLEQDAATRQVAVADLKRAAQGVTDPSTRANLEKAIRQIEAQNQPVNQMRSGDPVAAPELLTKNDPGPAGARRVTGLSEIAPASPPAREKSVWEKDPNRAYTDAVTRALVDAMIDYSAPMQISPDQWLTVAARDDEGRDSLTPPDPLEEVVTMIYRIKGSDLQEYRQGRIDRDEVRRRVQLSQF
ncbi:MAG TPA: hypothetical protein VJ691_01610 [Vicinamibacterales bacterium]|nr:hypothetical protein [Vicinamibacterales bacterium]